MLCSVTHNGRSEVRTVCKEFPTGSTSCDFEVILDAEYVMKLMYDLLSDFDMLSEETRTKLIEIGEEIEDLEEDYYF